MHKNFSIILFYLTLGIELIHFNQAIAAEKPFYAEVEPHIGGKAEISAEAIDVYKNFMWEFSLIPTDCEYLSEFPKISEEIAALYMDYARSHASHPLDPQPKVAYFLKGVRILREIATTPKESLKYSIKILEHLEEAKTLFGKSVKKSGYFYITPGHLPVHNITGHQRNSLVSHTQNRIYSILSAVFKQEISDNPLETFWSFCDKYPREIKAMGEAYKPYLQKRIQEIIALRQ